MFTVKICATNFQSITCPEHDKKVQLRKDISDIVKQELMEQGIHIDFEGIDLSASSQFFLWHTWYHDVFSRPSKEGFDIVIGIHHTALNTTTKQRGIIRIPM